MRKHIKDIVLVIGLLLVCCLGFLFLGGRSEEVGEIVRIMVDGETYGTYSLLRDQKILVEKGIGNNCILIENGKVSMENADCPDKYCVKHYAIDMVNETIVCLPHKLVIEIETDSKEIIGDEIDVVSW